MLRYVANMVMDMLIRVYILIDLLLQNEYAAILAKRVNEEKAKKTELRSKQIILLTPRIQYFHSFACNIYCNTFFWRTVVRTG